MAELPSIRVVRQDITQFDPTKTRRNNAILGYTINEAKKLKDWPVLVEAVHLKIEEQAQFIEWWRATVTPSHGAGRGNKKNADPHSFSMADAEAQTGIRQDQVSRWAASLKDREKYAARLCGSAFKAAMLVTTENKHLIGESAIEWYTPAEHIERARTVLGGIDLDPASCKEAQRVVQARRFLSKEDDGLSADWQGTVWLNPPYEQPSVSLFVQKLVQSYKFGDVTAAILLTNNSSDTAWFQEAANLSDALCLPRGRIRFTDDTGLTVGSPNQGQAFFYFGSDIERFASVFCEVGVILMPFSGEITKWTDTGTVNMSKHSP